MTEQAGGGPGPQEQHMLAAHAAAEGAQLAGAATALLERPEAGDPSRVDSALTAEQIQQGEEREQAMATQDMAADFMAAADTNHQEAKAREANPIMPHEDILSTYGKIGALHGDDESARDAVLQEHGINTKRSWTKSAAEHEAERKGHIDVLSKNLESKLVSHAEASQAQRDKELAEANEKVKAELERIVREDTQREGKEALERGKDAHAKMNEELEASRQAKADAKEAAEKAAFQDRIGVKRKEDEPLPKRQPKQPDAYKSDDTKGDRNYAQWLADGGQAGADQRKAAGEQPLPKRTPFSELRSDRSDDLAPKIVNGTDKAFDWSEEPEDPLDALHTPDAPAKDFFDDIAASNGGQPNVDPSKPYDFEQEGNEAASVDSSGDGDRLIGKNVYEDDIDGLDLAEFLTKKQDVDPDVAEIIDDSIDEPTRRQKVWDRFLKVSIGTKTLVLDGAKGAARYFGDAEKGRRRKNTLAAAAGGVLAVGITVAGAAIAYKASQYIGGHEGLPLTGGGGRRPSGEGIAKSAEKAQGKIEAIKEFFSSKENADAFSRYDQMVNNVKAANPVVEGGITPQSNPDRYNQIINDMIHNYFTQSEAANSANGIAGTV